MNARTQLNFKIDEKCIRTFEKNVKSIGQTKTQMVAMLIKAFNRTFEEHGCVALPLQLRTPSETQAKINISNSGDLAMDKSSITKGKK